MSDTHNSTPGRRFAEFIVLVTKVTGWLFFLGVTFVGAVAPSGPRIWDRIFAVVLAAIVGIIIAWLGRVVFYVVTGEKRPW